MKDNYAQGLTDLAAKLRVVNVWRNQGTAAFLLRCRDRIEKLEAELNRLRSVVSEADANSIVRTLCDD